jgi:hypothetical protein
MACFPHLGRKTDEVVDCSTSPRSRSTLQKVIDRSRLYTRATYWRIKDTFAAIKTAHYQRRRKRCTITTQQHKADSYQNEDTSISDESLDFNALRHQVDDANEALDNTDIIMCLRAGLVAQARRKKRNNTPPWLTATISTPSSHESNKSPSSFDGSLHSSLPQKQSDVHALALLRDSSESGEMIAI